MDEVDRSILQRVQLREGVVSALLEAVRSTEPGRAGDDADVTTGSDRRTAVEEALEQLRQSAVRYAAVCKARDRDRQSLEEEVLPALQRAVEEGETALAALEQEREAVRQIHEQFLTMKERARVVSALPTREELERECREAEAQVAAAREQRAQWQATCEGMRGELHTLQHSVQALRQRLQAVEQHFGGE